MDSLRVVSINMKIIIAPDKFKGSLTGIEFCNAVEQGIRKRISEVEILKLPLADGGDGTVEALQFYTKGEYVSVQVKDPLYREITAKYLFSPEQKIAFIEMAEASGIRLLKKGELNPLQTSTFGTGELIRDAIGKGAKHIILGIGGSSTNDAGMGMARALGFRFFDREENELQGTGGDLNSLYSIDSTKVIEELSRVRFEVACDVDNLLFGPMGAAFIYSPQKGASPEVADELDIGLKNFNAVVRRQYGKDLQTMPGAGAAGGMGAGCVLFLSARLKSGTRLMKEIACYDAQAKDADWIITGEGKLDQQTFSGKVIQGILESCTNQKLAVFCGINELDKNQLKERNIDFLAEIMSQAADLEDSVKNAAIYLENAAEYFAETRL